MVEVCLWGRAHDYCVGIWFLALKTKCVRHESPGLRYPWHLSWLSLLAHDCAPTALILVILQKKMNMFYGILGSTLQNSQKQFFIYLCSFIGTRQFHACISYMTGKREVVCPTPKPSVYRGTLPIWGLFFLLYNPLTLMAVVCRCMSVGISTGHSPPQQPVNADSSLARGGASCAPML